MKCKCDCPTADVELVPLVVFIAERQYFIAFLQDPATGDSVIFVQRVLPGTTAAQVPLLVCAVNSH